MKVNNLKLIKGQLIGSIDYIMQNEHNSNKLEVKVLDNYAEYVWEFKKPNEESYYTPRLFANNGVVEYFLPNELLDVSGRYEAQLITITNDYKMSSNVINFYVKGSINADTKIEFYSINDYLEGNLVEVTSNAETIRKYAFYQYDILESVNLPYAKEIKDDAFHWCKKLKNVNIPLVEQIGVSAFAMCDGLNKIICPSVETLSRSSFQYCFNLKVVDLHNVKEIDGYAFLKCSELNKLIIRTNEVCVLKNADAFTNSAIEKGTGYIYVPDELIGQYQAAENWSKFSRRFQSLSKYVEE